MSSSPYAMNHLSQLPDLAVEQFLNRGLYCSEAILQVYNAGIPLGLDQSALRMATAFGTGLGGARCCCGSLTGAVLVLSALKGRTSGQESEADVFSLANRMHDRFRDQFGTTCCRVLTRGVEWGSPEHPQFCAKYVRGASQILNELLGEGAVCAGEAKCAQEV
ncbi:MAG TPA: C-GCAxxG-C-C family protein [Polyangiaceae bacterium]|nr:C-GCAxxG-C-C family protein [Polyangiaceae bacterium]